jgi:ABC-type Zn uptake system ZnuABC Zn-binding protein ZnuA
MIKTSLIRCLPAALIVWLAFPVSGSAADDKVQVVATLTTLGSIAQAIGGEHIDLMVIADGAQDAHYVDPKPSFMTRLRKADLLLLKGLDLEVGWVPPLTQGSRNPKILRGGAGYIDCSANMPVVEIPTSLSRAEGDIHPYGMDPDHAAAYADGQRAFVDKLHRSLFGDELVDLVGGIKLSREALAGRLDVLLDGTSLGGKPLRSRLGGWMGRMEPLRGSELITYYRDYSYLAARYGLRVVDTVEPKPGILPSAKHLEELVKTVQSRNIRVIVSRPYAEHRSTDLLTKRTGVRVIDVPLDVDGAPGTGDFFALQTHVVDVLVETLSGGNGGRS